MLSCRVHQRRETGELPRKSATRALEIKKATFLKQYYNNARPNGPRKAALHRSRRILIDIFSIPFHISEDFLDINNISLCISLQVFLYHNWNLHLRVEKEAQGYFTQNISYEEKQTKKYLLQNALNYQILIKHGLEILLHSWNLTGDKAKTPKKWNFIIK